MKKDASSPPLTDEEERRLVEMYGELVRFPVAGDRFFADAGPALVNIDPNYSRRIFKNPGDPNFLLFKEYARGYEEAVEELCLAVFRRPELRRKLVFPIITCVHQHLGVCPSIQP